jgi:hypothetical protein
MYAAIPSRHSAVRFIAFLMLCILMPSWIACAQTTAPAAPASPPATTPPATSPPEVRRALRDFDRFLDHHPLLEDRLRLKPGLSTDASFLQANPELRDFLRVNPHVAEGLTIYPRYYLNRALQRQASEPVSFRDLGTLKELFQQQPNLEQELNRNPESIRDPGFLSSHAGLRDFLLQRPPLAKVFLPRPVSPESK